MCVVVRCCLLFFVVVCGPLWSSDVVGGCRRCGCCCSLGHGVTARTDDASTAGNCVFLSIFCCPAQCFRGLVSGGCLGGFAGGGCFSFGVQTSGEYISTMFGCI